MREIEVILGLIFAATLLQPIARVISDLDLDEIRNVEEPVI